MDERDTDQQKKVTGMTEPQTRSKHNVPQASGAPLALPNDVQAYIGRQLRAVYDDVVSQPVPDRFIRLLEELERKHGGRS